MNPIANFRAVRLWMVVAFALSLAACGQPSPTQPTITADTGTPDIGGPTDIAGPKDAGGDALVDAVLPDSALPDGPPTDLQLPDQQQPDDLLADGEQPDALTPDGAQPDGAVEDLPNVDDLLGQDINPSFANVCNPCKADGECGATGALCVSYGDTGSFCGGACAVNSDCPSGYGCQDSKGTAGSGKQCVLLSGECACSAQAIAQGASTSCAVSSSIGACQGTRSCMATGLSACSAATPAIEACNGLDDNCDGKTDEGCDKDGDGYCDATMEVVGTPAVCPKGGGDCNDNAASIAPDATETCNDLDDNCNGKTDEGCDADGDGWCTTSMDVLGTPASCPKGGGDCNDQVAAISPGATEVCANGIDDNCDGITDEGINASGCKVFYFDADKDTFGTVASQCTCNPMGSYTAAVSGDCDDTDAAVNPAQQEVCGNGKDDNCNGQTDEAGGSACVSFYADADGDGYGAGAPVCLCTADAIHTVTKSGDCDDANAAVNPGATEACNGVDDNCDGVTDGQDSAGCTQFYPDADKDGYGNSLLGACLCAADAAHPVSVGGDCDDTNAAVSLGSPEICDGVDNNCNGLTDEANATGCKTAYADGDGDTYGNNATTQCLCTLVAAYPTWKGGDCNDASSAVHPNATEACNGIDDNCDGVTDEENATGCKAWLLDADSDGYGVKGASKCLCAAALPYDATVSGDCDDANAAIHPGAKEVCDGKDNNCDGITDNPGATGCTVYFLDADKDAYGSVAVASQCTCSAKGTFTATVGGDCNDSDAGIHPNATEKCDGIDNNCDGATDPVGSQGCAVWFADVDKDTFGNSADSECACGAAGKYTTKTGGDCDDNTATTYPGAYEKCNGVDDNCNGLTDVDSPDVQTWYYDGDGDGVGTASFEVVCFADGKYSAKKTGDCNDANASVYPGATETCNGIDDNCNGLTDEANAADCVVWHADVDGDGYGSATDKACLCAATSTYTTVIGGDCDDSKAAVHPGAAEVCNGMDDDCNGKTDEAGAGGCTVRYVDADLDTYGDSAKSACVCSASDGFTATVGGDCDDALAAVHPGAAEVCNGLDDNCDGVTDPMDTPGCSTFFLDADADGYGVTGNTECWCAANTATHYTATKGGDCNDATAAAHPGATEVCGDGIDNNCDGLTDDPGSLGCLNYFPDADADGYGAASPAKQCLCAPTGIFTTTSGGDCDDSNAAVHPNAYEKCNGIDDNCNGVTDDDSPDQVLWFYDSDGDGYGTEATLKKCFAAGKYTATAGGDCDDANAAVHPGAQEICNHLDDNCDGLTDNGAPDVKTWYFDGDADGYGTSVSKVQCFGSGSYTATVSGDCNDANAAVHPGAYEACNGLDDNCNGVTDDDSPDAKVWYFDGDGDTYGGAATEKKCAATGLYTATAGGDCDDTNALVHPGATEVCDGLDNNCDGLTDDPGSEGCSQYLKDADFDGYGVWGLSKCLCGPGVGDPTYSTTAGGDCDDANAAINPAAIEKCDGIDNNCDGLTDDAGSAGCTLYYRDNDKDGFGAASPPPECLCAATANFSALLGGDCNDYSAAVHPGAYELCNGIDDNCNGVTDDDSPDAKNWYHDLDGDSYGTGTPVLSCSASFNYSASQAGDCNDTRPDIHPGAYEFCDGVDNNCNGVTDDDSPDAKNWYMDGDGDGFGAGTPIVKCSASGAYKVLTGTDCDDTKPLVHPNAVETCNGIDDNCNGQTDEEGASGCVFYMVDADLDKYGVFGVSKCLCGPGTGAPTYTATVGGDCNDADAAINPGATEKCDGIDNNCDSITDGAGSAGCLAYYVDGDGDGYATNAAAHQCLCAATEPYTTLATGDCDDSNNKVHPNAYELCNGVDDNCNGITDSDSPDAKTWYYDGDGDGYGTTVHVTACAATGFYSSTVSTDCDDTAFAIHPGATEKCNGIDDNCNGLTDDGLPMTNYHPDADGDGFGSSAVTVALCAPKFGLLLDASDCDDGNAAIHPGATETCNGVDDNCNGATDEASAATMCPSVLNGAPACIAGACAAACNAKWYDLDKNLANGCECSADSHFGVAGDSGGNPIDLGTLTDAGSIATGTGNIMPGENGDWYKVYAQDMPDSDGGCDTFNLDAKFATGTDAGFALDLYRDGYAIGNVLCGGVTESGWTTRFSGAAYGPQTGSGVIGGYVSCPATEVCSPYLSPNPAQAGECHCVNAPTGSGLIADAQVNYCRDDSATFYIRVYRTTTAADCSAAQYTLQVSNGL